MTYQFVPYNILLLLSALITIALGVHGIRHRAAPGTKAFAISMFIGTLWSVANALEISALTLDHKLVWANIQYIAYSLVPVVWIIMVLQISDRASWVTMRNFILLLIIPIITISLVWLDEVIGFVRHDIYLDTYGPISVICKKYSPWFWLHFTQAYLLNFSSIILLIKTIISKTTIYRYQSIFLLVGTGLIAVFNISYIMGIHLISYDVSPLIFSISGAIISLGIFRFGLFHLVPIARKKVFEAMKNIVIVVDVENTIVDVNPAAIELFAKNSNYILIGKPLGMICEELEVLVNQNELLLLSEVQILQISGDLCRSFEVKLSPISGKKEALMGRVIVMSDITELKQAQEELYREQKELAIMAERDRMAKDLHDNLGQIFSFAGIQIQAVKLERQRGNQELADSYMERLGEIIQDAHQEMRKYIYNTRIEEYRNNSIENLIINQINIFVKNSGYFSRKDINLKLTNYEFTMDIKMHIVNIVKEALNNILKHACATYVKINLVKDSNYYKLLIEDNGIGFIHDNSGSTKGSGSGLCIMEERARLLGGSMTVDTSHGKYTKIKIQFPDHIGVHYDENNDC